MKPNHLRRVLFAATLLTLSGCSTLPKPAPGHTATEPVRQPPSAVATKTIDTEHSPELAAAHALQKSGRQEAPAEAPAERAANYTDLFDRIRAGYSLGDINNDSIEQQLQWYARHPQYLDRTFGRGERYLYHIVTELESRQMPLELALLPVVESAFEPFGYSRARASGLWQFISATGTRFGLKQNWWYDGRRDVVESTRAALDYLESLHSEFGDWLLAVAAYNCGENNVRRAIKRNLKDGKPTDFWHLKLPRETRAYVPKLMAMSRLVAKPAACDVQLAAIPNVPFFAIVPTGGQIDLRMAAEMAGVTHEELTYLNPGFNRWATDPDGPHHLLLPVQACEAFAANLDQLPHEERIQVTRYAVRKGDTLSTIASRHGTSVPAIMQLNGMSSTFLRAGQDLMLPGGGSLHPKVAMAAQRYDGRATVGNRRYHVVRSGDTLWSIARRYGLKVHTLASLNGMKPNEVLSIGRRLVLRGG